MVVGLTIEYPTTVTGMSATISTIPNQLPTGDDPPKGLRHIAQ
jgi:hypothetical protein